LLKLNKTIDSENLTTKLILISEWKSTPKKEKKNQTQSREPRKRLERCNWYGY
jgi:hypothetical protein